jgi:hypothetical protein
MDPAILLIDSDLGFLFWLGHALDQAGYEAFPAKSVPDASTLVGELHRPVGLLILNCSSPAAEQFIATMRESNEFLKTICLDGEGHLSCISGIDAVCRKPVQFDEHSKAQWMHLVRTVLATAPQRHFTPGQRVN